MESFKKFNNYQERKPVNLEKLCLDYSTISQNAMHIVLSICENLKSFTYSCGGATCGDEQFEPKELIEKLLELHGEKLEELTLDFEQHFESFNDMVERVGDLTKFTALKRLTIRQEDLIGQNSRPICTSCTGNYHCDARFPVCK